MRRVVCSLAGLLILLLFGAAGRPGAHAQTVPSADSRAALIGGSGLRPAAAPAVGRGARLTHPASDASRALFHRIELGFVAGNPSLILEQTAESVELDLGDSRRGNYSSNQSFFLLQDFFRACVPVSFSFNRYGAGRQPFAVGQYEYLQRDAMGQSRVFVSLGQAPDGSWRLVGIRVDPVVP